MYSQGGKMRKPVTQILRCGNSSAARALVWMNHSRTSPAQQCYGRLYIIIIYTVYYYKLYLLNLDEHIYTHYTLYNNIIIQTTTEAAAAVAQSIIQILATVLFSFYFLRLPQRNRNVRTRAQYIHRYDSTQYNVYYIPLRPCCRRIR